MYKFEVMKNESKENTTTTTNIIFNIEYLFCLVTLHKQAKQHLLSQNFLIERIRISFYRIAYRDWIKSFLIVYGAESLADLNHKLNGLRQ